MGILTCTGLDGHGREVDLFQCPEDGGFYVVEEGARRDIPRPKALEIIERWATDDERELALGDSEQRGPTGAPPARRHGPRDFYVSVDARAFGKLLRAYPGIDADGMSAVVEALIEVLPDPGAGGAAREANNAGGGADGKD